MAEKIPNIYQFKITLKGTKPKIWRRIQVPKEYNFRELHHAIQHAMGWLNCHLHQFEIINPQTGQQDRIGVPDPDGFFSLDIPELPEHTLQIAQYFLSPKDKAMYEYDFGDRWEHEVLLEKILPAVVGAKYPQCPAGRMACPPEDCGGVYGYKELLKIIADPNHPEYKERMEWLGMFYPDYNPTEFDPKSIDFDSVIDLTDVI